MPEPDEFLSFAEHQARLTLFVDECTAFLRQSGLQDCEARMEADWNGHASFVRNAMTTGRMKDGQSVVLTAKAALPLPWLVEQAGGKPKSVEDIMKQALLGSEGVLTDLAAKARVLRLNVSGYSDKCSRRIQVARTLLRNGGSRSSVIELP